MIFRLTEALVFPNPLLAESDGLLAVGGDLSTERLVLAYKNGIFPWYSSGEPILWYAPKDRCVIYPKNIHISKSMQREIKSKKFTITENQDFKNVIRCCAGIARKDQDGTWISDEMQQAYLKLFDLKIAKSIEVWNGTELVGGLYGVDMGNVFCGESMFSFESNASKHALISLCTQNTYQIIDCQIPNDHLLSMGAELISNKHFLNLLKMDIKKEDSLQ